MTTVRDIKVRTRDTVRKLVKPADVLPKRGYAHFFIETEGIHSRLHLHHFYSLFLPDLDEAVQVHIRVHDEAGKTLGTVTRSLTSFASLNLPASELLGELGSSAPMGTVSWTSSPLPGTTRR